MKKHDTPCELDTLRPEYDFSGSVRARYAKRLEKSTNFVRLDPDVARAFPTPEAVNGALRLLAQTARRCKALRARKKAAA